MSQNPVGPKRHLLAMLGGGPPPPLSAEEWEALDAMAGQHRLQPLLAYRLDHAAKAWPVPSAMARGWRAARHRAGLASLAQQAALRLVAQRLDAAGLRFCALKGPRLAWSCYPEPGLRPMRDLDLLVAEDDVLRAATILGKAGFAMDADAGVLAESLADKHLPMLRHERLGVAIELHHRLSDPPDKHGYHVPQLDGSGMLDRSETVSLAGVVVPCPTASDLLEHLMVHALYGHRLDCGPLVLADIHFLLASHQVDSGRLRRQARDGGWERGAALLIALTTRYFGPQPWGSGEVEVPPQAIAAAEEAMLQNLSGRGHAEALADVLAARSPAALAGTLAKRLRPSRQVVYDEGGGLTAWRFWPVWAWRRLRRLVSSLLDRRARHEARHAAALLRWLQS